MKKSLLLSFTLFAFALGFSQKGDIKDAKDTGQYKGYNKWTVELNAGQSKGSKPFTEGYYSSDPNKFFGAIRFNSYNIAARYMFSARFGLKADVKLKGAALHFILPNDSLAVPLNEEEEMLE